MGTLDFTFVDVLVVAVIVVSAGYAAYRGFVRESLSIFAGAAAALAALYLGPSVVPLLKGLVSGWAATLIAYVGVFTLVFLPFGFISFRFSQNVRHSPVQGLDRILGFAFGVARGLVIIGAAYLVFTMLVPVARQPGWITKARLLPLIQESSLAVSSVLPDRHKKAARREAAHRRATVPERHDAARSAPKAPKKTYGAKERRALDRLIETTDKGGGS
jgi:membrane protein required for colicin V production